MLQVGHIFRFHPVTTALRERLAAGALGRVRYCTGRFAGFKRPRTDVGVTQTDAIHYFDLFALPARARGDRGHRDAARLPGPRPGRLLVHHRGVRGRPRLRRGGLLRARHLPGLCDRRRARHARRRLRDLGSARARQPPRGDRDGLAGARRARSRASRPRAPSRCDASSSCSSTRRPVAAVPRWTSRRGWPRCARSRRRSARRRSAVASPSPSSRSPGLAAPPRTGSGTLGSWTLTGGTLLVPKGGLEPPHPCGHMTLNHARLPIPPLRPGARTSSYGPRP